VSRYVKAHVWFKKQGKKKKKKKQGYLEEMFGIFFLYRISFCTSSLRPFRIFNNQNIRCDSHFNFSLIKDKNLLSPYICQIDTIREWTHFAAMPHTYDRIMTPLETFWIKFYFYLIIMFYCLVYMFTVNINFLYLFSYAF